jgi:hypothetical protein
VEPPHYSVRSPCYDQVLTGILPYGDSDREKIAADIRRGKRPSRRWGPGRNRQLHNAVWDTIKTCWSDKPEQRCELSVVYKIFSEYGRQETRNIEPGDLNTRHNGHLIAAEMSCVEIGQQQRGRFIPRITSLFQFLRESEPEIERNVSEMDKACSSAFFPLFLSQDSHEP